ncbi:YlmC/YmxH family sporulation protein [Clostridium tarantellae]|uniref:YlmC/YmxH family sporulation protein n=1 Tax=Clostridium tarantellae TaxID=39493 RepID=A0A6I1MJ85_9CLOT|nr:YlmC/YmxH family sporulation protein [Clostridium tarantellae]MPQ42468.1 YlmC/YmxH family sporulation protein [Clostridium tarantellae]
MEEILFSLNNLRSMEVINVLDGKRLGFINDVKIDCDENRIISLLIPGEKSSWFSKGDAIEVQWENVEKVGLDVILVNLETTYIENKDMDKYI